MNCKNCGYFPCVREECDIKNDKCLAGKSYIEVFSRNMEKESKYGYTKLYTNGVS